LLLVAFLLVDAPNCHLSLVLASVVQGDAVNCNIYKVPENRRRCTVKKFNSGIISWVCQTGSNEVIHVKLRKRKSVRFELFSSFMFLCE